MFLRHRRRKKSSIGPSLTTLLPLALAPGMYLTAPLPVGLPQSPATEPLWFSICGYPILVVMCSECFQGCWVVDFLARLAGSSTSSRHVGNICPWHVFRVWRVILSCVWWLVSRLVVGLLASVAWRMCYGPGLCLASSCLVRGCASA